MGTAELDQKMQSGLDLDASNVCVVPKGTWTDTAFVCTLTPAQSDRSQSPNSQRP